MFGFGWVFSRKERMLTIESRASEGSQKVRTPRRWAMHAHRTHRDRPVIVVHTVAATLATFDRQSRSNHNKYDKGHVWRAQSTIRTGKALTVHGA